MISEHSARITTGHRSKYGIQLPLPVTTEELARFDAKDSAQWLMTLELARKQEAWVVTVRDAYGLTNNELRKHCKIREAVKWPNPTDTKIEIVLTMEIHWTRWMKLKRWWRNN